MAKTPDELRSSFESFLVAAAVAAAADAKLQAVKDALAAAQSEQTTARQTAEGIYQAFLVDLAAVLAASPAVAGAAVESLAAPGSVGTASRPRLGDGTLLRAIRELAKATGLPIGNGQLVGAAIRIAVAVATGTPFEAALAKELTDMLANIGTGTPAVPPTAPPA